jgi:hypothetical protein
MARLDRAIHGFPVLTGAWNALTNGTVVQACMAASRAAMPIDAS